MCVGGVWGWGGCYRTWGRKNKFDKGDRRDLECCAEGPVRPDRKQGDWPGLRLSMPQRLGLCRRQLRTGRVGDASTQGGRQLGGGDRKITEQQVMSGLPGSTFGLVGDLGHSTSAPNSLAIGRTKCSNT